MGLQEVLGEQIEYLEQDPNIKFVPLPWPDYYGKAPKAIVSPDGKVYMGKATVEVFRMFDGQWYRGEFDLFPGDPVGQVPGISNVIKPAPPVRDFLVLG